MRTLVLLLLFLGFPCLGQIETNWIRFNELQNTRACLNPSNATLDGLGDAIFTLQANSETCSDTDINGNILTTATMNYTSGKVMSYLTFTYGTVEFRAKFPLVTADQPKAHSTVWMLGTNCYAIIQHNMRWDSDGCFLDGTGYREVDMAEFDDTSSTVDFSIHDSTGAHTCTYSIDGTQWHVYDMTWTSGTGVLAIDGSTVCTLSGSYVPSLPMFFILGLVSETNTPSGNPSFPVSMLVDYIQLTCVSGSTVNGNSCSAGTVAFRDDFNPALFPLATPLLRY